MSRLTPERVRELREEAPDVYEAYLELADIRARLWNALVWFESSTHWKFTGRLTALARTLADESRDETGSSTGMDNAVERMVARGWDTGSGC